MGRESQARTLMPNFTVVTFKIWAYSPKIAKISNFWYIFALQEIYFFTKFGLGEGVPGPHR